MAVAAERRKLFDKKKNVPAGYALAAGAAGGAVFFHWSLAEWLGTHHLPWAAYYIAVMLIEWWIGWRQALLTAAIGLVAGLWVDYFPSGAVDLRDEALWAH